MKMVLTRRWFTPHSTIGELAIDGAFECYVLEDVVRPEGAPKVPGQTAIPYGEYDVIVNQSRRFGRPMPLLLDVPGFAGVRIHAGNTAADTEGCLLLGCHRAPNGDAIERSREAFNRFFPVLLARLAKPEHCWISIEKGDPR